MERRCCARRRADGAVVTCIAVQRSCDLDRRRGCMGEPGHGRRHCQHHYPPECYGVARISLVGSNAWAVWL